MFHDVEMIETEDWKVQRKFILLESVWICIKVYLLLPSWISENYVVFATTARSIHMFAYTRSTEKVAVTILRRMN